MGSAYEIIAQIIRIVAMGLNVISFVQKEHKTVITFQFFGSLLFVINYLMLAAPTGAMMNAIALVRAIIFTNKEKFRADRPIWVGVFSIFYIAAYILTFTVFGKELSTRNIIVELLPVIAMVIQTISFVLPNAKDIRNFAYAVSPLWLTYNVINAAIGGVLCESFALISVTIGKLKHDRKKVSTNENNRNR